MEPNTKRHNLLKQHKHVQLQMKNKALTNTQYKGVFLDKSV